MAAGSSDPLSLLADDDSSSESEEERDESQEKTKLTDKSYYTSPASSDPVNKLPSPDTLFTMISRPHFLTTHIDPHHINWDKLTKNTTQDNNSSITDQSDAHEARSSSKYTAIPPPTHINESSNTSEISKAPVRYVIEKEENENEEFEVAITGEGGTKAGSKRSQDDETALGETKKQKVETFREKEKRKRDLGMSSRGKNFVEEEKRILREHFEK